MSGLSYVKFADHRARCYNTAASKHFTDVKYGYVLHETLSDVANIHADVHYGQTLRVRIINGNVDLDSRHAIMSAVLTSCVRTGDEPLMKFGAWAVLLGHCGFPVCDPRTCDAHNRIRHVLPTACGNEECWATYSSFPVLAEEEDMNDYVVDIPIGHSSRLGLYSMQGEERQSVYWGRDVLAYVASGALVLHAGWQQEMHTTCVDCYTAKSWTNGARLFLTHIPDYHVSSNFVAAHRDASAIVVWSRSVEEHVVHATVAVNGEELRPTCVLANWQLFVFEEPLTHYDLELSWPEPVAACTVTNVLCLPFCVRKHGAKVHGWKKPNKPPSFCGILPLAAFSEREFLSDESSVL